MREYCMGCGDAPHKGNSPSWELHSISPHPPVEQYSSEKMRNGLKLLHQGRCMLGIRRNFFTKRTVQHWNRLPREAVEPPSL